MNYRILPLGWKVNYCSQEQSCKYLIAFNRDPKIQCNSNQNEPLGKSILIKTWRGELHLIFERVKVSAAASLSQILSNMCKNRPFSKDCAAFVKGICDSVIWYYWRLLTTRSSSFWWDLGRPVPVLWSPAVHPWRIAAHPALSGLVPAQQQEGETQLSHFWRWFWKFWRTLCYLFDIIFLLGRR